MSPPLSAKKIKSNLNTTRIGSEILVFDAVSSTNDLAKQYLEQNVAEGLVLIAESQTRGRGRMGRTWMSLSGIGLYLSVILKPDIQLRLLPQLTLLAGLATTLAINEFIRKKAQLKWPNDILLNGKKCCGILCETHVSKNGEAGVIIGIGINANHSIPDFPDDLTSSATSLMIETGNVIDRQALVHALICNLDQQYDAYLGNGEQTVIEKWLENSDMVGKKITVTLGKSAIHGTALGLDSQGRLLMRSEKGEELTFDSGEVSLHSSAEGARPARGKLLTRKNVFLGW